MASTSMFSAALVLPACRDAFRKLNPREFRGECGEHADLVHEAAHDAFVQISGGSGLLQ